MLNDDLDLSALTDDARKGLRSPQVVILKKGQVLYRFASIRFDARTGRATAQGAATGIGNPALSGLLDEPAGVMALQHIHELIF